MPTTKSLSVNKMLFVEIIGHETLSYGQTLKFTREKTMLGILKHTARFAVIAAAALSILLGGCGSGPEEKPAKEGKPVVGVLVYRQDDTYIGLVTKAIVAAFSDKVEVTVLFAENDQLLQNGQIDTLLRKKVDALALNIVDTQAAGAAVDTIKKAGIPVVFFNREPDLAGIKAYDRARFVGTDPFDAGIMQGDIIKELWEKHPEFDKNRDGKFQYLMIQANLDNSEALARTEYSVKQARAVGVPMSQVGETLLCSWDKSIALEAVTTTFPLYEGKIELIIANNDAMALGAIQALNKTGYNLPGGDRAKFIPIVGVDAIPDAVAAIKGGVMSGTVVQDSDSMGKAIAAMLLNAVDGKDFLNGLPYSWDESGIAVRIPYSRFVNAD